MKSSSKNGLTVMAARFAGTRGSLKAEITHGVAGSLVLTVANMLLRLGASVLLARVLGADGLGIYTFALSIVALMQIPTQLGLPQLVVREVAALREKGQWGLLRGLLSRANQGVAALGVGMAAIGLVVGLILLRYDDSDRIPSFLAALPLLPIVALSSLRQASLRGLRHVVIGQTPEQLIYPGLMILALAGGYGLMGSGFLTPLGAVWVNVAAAILAFAAGSWFLLKRMPVEVRGHAPEFQSRLWLRLSMPFMLLAGLNAINSQLTIVMLGAMRNDAEVGVMQVCLTAAAPVAFGLAAANAVVAPHVSRLWTRHDLVSMQQVITGAAKIALAVAVVLTAIVIAFGGPLLAFFFGEEFRQGSTVLVIVALGQLVNAAFGSVGIILNMTGHTRLALRGFAIAVAVNLILNATLIPSMGIKGAAIGALASFILWNSILFVYVRRKVGVWSLAFGGRRWGPKASLED